MRYAKLSVLLLCVLTVMVAFYGCGSSSKEGTASGTSPNSVGDTMCRQCHSAVLDPLTGQGIVAQYDNTSPHRDSPYANNGNGCEACHGGGAQHNGVGPIPYPDPFADNGTRCVACHTGTYQTNAPTMFASSRHSAGMTLEEGDPCRRCHTHEGAVLGMTYGLTGDGHMLKNEAYIGAVPFAREYTVLQCGTCHEHGGGLRAVKGRDELGNIVNFNPAQTSFANNQVNLCTGCHTYKSFDGKMVMGNGDAVISFGAVTVPGTLVGRHETSWYRTLATTHYNNPNNAAAGISGYVIRENGEKPCFDCHGHEWKANTDLTNPAVTTGSRAYKKANETIWTQWAKSGHAGQILKVKMAAVSTGSGTAAVNTAMTTTVGEATAAPWIHYDWSSVSRQACQRCHTATGVSNYLTNPATYVAANNDYSHLWDVNKVNRDKSLGGLWSTSSRTATQREMLYCWGCHANVEADKGGLRNPGALTFTYTGLSNTVTAAYPNASSSNVCIACHTGLATGELIATSTADFTNKGYLNAHYLTAGATVFAKSGYTYETRDYSIPAGDQHDKIGFGAAVGNANFDAVTGNYTGGPCITCHFGSNDGPHTLSPVTQYTTTDTALNPVCVNCHTTRGAGSNAAIAWLGDDATAATLQGTTHKARYQAAIEALKVLLAANGYTYTTNYPYFATTNWTVGVSTNGKHNMGAAYNFNLLAHDPGGVAHNRRYTRRLIYDSIDHLDNGALDYSVSGYLETVNTSTYYTSARAYLINTAATTSAGERF